MPRKATALLCATIITACADTESPTATQVLTPAGRAQGSVRIATNDARTLASAVRGTGLQNQILIWIKKEADAPLDPDFILNNTREGNLRVGVPRPGPGQSPARSYPQPRELPVNEITAVKSALSRFSIAPRWEGRRLPVMLVRVPDISLEEVLAALLNHPNVLLIEADEPRNATPTIAPPATRFGHGFAETDSKHTFHKVTEA